MWRVFLQKFSGSIKIDNYQGQEVVGRYWDTNEAHKEIDKLLKKAEADGYSVVEGSYFTKDYKTAFSFVMTNEDPKPKAFEVDENLWRGGSRNAR